jgi:predicted amidophosphoribosyltransferase
MPSGPLLAGVLALLVPPSCLACGVPLRGAGAALCSGCRALMPWLRGPRCARCALPALAARPPTRHPGSPDRAAAASSGCRRCPAARAAFEAAWTPVAYGGPARALVTALKFRGASAAADAMAAQMAASAPPGFLEHATLVPVPTHRTRRRRRGFDQAERLTRALARRTGRPVARCLRREGPATRQLGARRAARLSAGRIAIRVRGSAPPIALLVDDVYTTGATLDACATALRRAGSRTVRAIAYARTLDGAPRRLYDGT